MDGVVAQLTEHLLPASEDSGSNPVYEMIFTQFWTRLATTNKQKNVSNARVSFLSTF